MCCFPEEELGTALSQEAQQRERLGRWISIQGHKAARAQANIGVMWGLLVACISQAYYVLMTSLG